MALSILIPLAVAADPSPWGAVWFLVPMSIGTAIGFSGLYIVAAVYLGLPLPQTAAEREFTPRLKAVEAHVLGKTIRGAPIFQIAFNNEGRGDVTDALVNVIAPNFVSALQRRTENGVRHPHEGACSTTSESLIKGEDGNPVESIYWNGNVTFPGRVHRIIYFHANMESPRSFPIRVQVISVALAEPVSARFDLLLPD